MEVEKGADFFRCGVLGEEEGVCAGGGYPNGRIAGSGRAHGDLGGDGTRAQCIDANGRRRGFRSGWGMDGLFFTDEGVECYAKQVG